MRIDVIIPSYKPDIKLKKLLDKLSVQKEKIQNIIIVNTGEKYFEDFLNNNNCVLSENVKVFHIDESEFDHGKTRNFGVSKSGADIIILMTQDAVPYDDELVSNIIKPILSREKTAACYARQMAGENSGIDEVFSRNFNYPDEPRIKTKDDINTIGIKAFFCSNVCAAYDKKVFDKLGGFINQAIFNEDMVYARKLLDNGYEIAYEPSARVIHSHDYSAKEQMKRNFDLGVSQAMNPETFSGISSESEGVKYVLAAFKYFLSKGKPFVIVPFAYKCLFKLIGFKKGKNFNSLSKKEIYKYTSNKRFFDKYYMGK